MGGGGLLLLLLAHSDAFFLQLEGCGVVKPSAAYEALKTQYAPTFPLDTHAHHGILTGICHTLDYISAYPKGFPWLPELH